LTLEPTLVTRLKLHDVQGTVGNGGRDELVASALVAVGGAREDFVLVVRLALGFARVHVKHGSGGNLVRRETTLGARGARVGLDAEQVAELIEVRLRLAEVFNLRLGRLLRDDGDVRHLVKVILKVHIRVRERALLGRVVLGREQERVAIAGVRDKACGSSKRSVETEESVTRANATNKRNQQTNPREEGRMQSSTSAGRGHKIHNFTSHDSSNVYTLVKKSGRNPNPSNLNLTPGRVGSDRSIL